MQYHKITRGLALLRFFRIRLFLKKSKILNFKHKFSSWAGLQSIVIGERNIFHPHSIINAGFNSKIISIVIGNGNIVDINAVLFSHGGKIVLGNNNFIGPRVQIQGRGEVHIGNNCLIAGNTFISSSNHNIDNPTSAIYLKKEIGNRVEIEDKVWIGANCVITAGVHIGKCAVIGAGSVVTKDIDPYTLVAGSPAKVLKKYNFEEQNWSKF